MLLLGIIDNGLVLARVPLYWQDLVTGLIIILAVASSAFQSFSKVRSRRKTIKIEGDPACQD
jgi:ribose/xylose/arabinose/galactoside ABC-type transport system permease subunit